MATENGAHEQWGDVPPPMDEQWWSALLTQEERYAPHHRRRGEGSSRDQENDRGSPEDWAWARGLYEADDTIELKVIGYNRGGVLVEARSLRGFVPISHLMSVTKTENAGTDYLAALVNTSLNLKVIEFDPERGRLVLSERAAQSAPGQRLELLARLQPGDRVSGTVTNVTRFGVFVDLGGVEGLIHVSELSWGRVRHPEDVISVGQDIEVQVLSVDPEQGRVALSLKELLPDPWESVEVKFQLGDEVEGTITNVVKFGAFVGIEEGLEGLIHVSELGDGNFLHPRGVVREGEKVTARIIHIDASERRLGLSLRGVSQLSQGEEDAEVASEEEEILPSY